ncbi:MAG: ATP-binding cassette domain-containing protein [Candidatus Acidiferrales bacterium]
MALEVEIQKHLAEFTLDIAFTTGASPLGVLGPSGAGKTMLLRCIAGLERPERGRIALDGRVLLDTTRNIDVPARQRHVGLLFQHYALFPHRTAAENITFGLRDLGGPERAERLAALSARTHITGLQDRFPRELSGGEQQRVALARALAAEPRALLLDEPFSALDTYLRGQLEAELQETLGAYQRPTLLVTHNMEEAYRLGARLLVLVRGSMVAFGGKEEIFRQPPSVAVARVTGCKNISGARGAPGNQVEAVDWDCHLRVSQEIVGTPKHIGIRAHHIEFLESAGGLGVNDNVFPCWPVRASESPFRVTLFLRLHAPPAPGAEPHLQAEVFKEKWERFRARPLPWHVRLSPDALFLLQD